MRVIDSHIHFPEDRIIDDGKDHGASTGVGYTSGRSPSAGVNAGEASVAARSKSEAWLDSEKARWEAAWRFPPAIKVSLNEGERLWAQEMDTYDYLKAVVFVTAGSNSFASELVSRHPDRFAAYAHHDPELIDAPERLEKAVKEGGLKGYKILGPKVSRPLSDPTLDPLWESLRLLAFRCLFISG